MSESEEKDLIARAQSGDHEAFDQLWERYEKPIFRLCSRILGNDADAEEALVETGIRAWKSLPSFRGQARFLTWLSGIAQNVCTGMVQPPRGSREQFSLDDPKSLGLPDPAPIPEEKALQSDQSLVQAVLEEARQAKPPWDRLDYEIFVRHYGEGESYQEIARILDKPPGTISSRVRTHIKPVLERVERQFKRNENG